MKIGITGFVPGNNRHEFPHNYPLATTGSSYFIGMGIQYTEEDAEYQGLIQQTILVEWEEVPKK